ncbi:CHRD domain-containing protein [Gymnodinialimonas ulvae]|uniref:CHRD domain-containing protein n=1 Tax=Gymnodinialimonas ulvae TaxID=3126504 RepID=UPI0030A6E445
MKMFNLKAIVPFVAAVVVSTAAHAGTVTFESLLNGAQEVAGAGPTSVPAPNDSPALGAGVINVDYRARSIDVSLTVLGISLDDLNDGLVAAPVGPVHLHRAPVGVNGPIVVPFGFGDNYTSIGTDLGFELVANDLTADDFLGRTFHQLVRDLNAGDIYFNVHTDAFAGGEIRGQVAAVIAPVPVPASGLLLGGMLAFGAWRVRSKKRAAATA